MQPKRLHSEPGNVNGRRVVTITISMPRRLLRQVNRLRKQYSYATMSEYVRERLQADLRMGKEPGASEVAAAPPGEVKSDQEQP